MQRSLVVIPWNIHESLVFSRYTHEPFGACVYRVLRCLVRVCIPRKFKRQVGCSMVCHDRALSTRIIPYHGIRLYSSQHFQCNIRAAHDGKAGYNPIECTAAVLYSDWLYFLAMVWYKFLYNTMCLNKLAIILTRISTNSLLTFSLIDSILQF